MNDFIIIIKSQEWAPDFTCLSGKPSSMHWWEKLRQAGLESWNRLRSIWHADNKLSLKWLDVEIPMDHLIIFDNPGTGRWLVSRRINSLKWPFNAQNSGRVWDDLRQVVKEQTPEPWVRREVLVGAHLDSGPPHPPRPVPGFRMRPHILPTLPSTHTGQVILWP